MKELQALQATQNLISSIEEEVFEDIIVGTQQRGFAHITTSSLTPPTAYYFVAIFATSPEEYYPTVIIPQSFYDITITVIDYIVGITGETELFETMGNQFTLVTDRIVNKLRTESFTADDGSTFRLELPEKRISKNNRPVSWEDAESYFAYCFSEISFRLESC